MSICSRLCSIALMQTRTPCIALEGDYLVKH